MSLKFRELRTPETSMKILNQKFLKLEYRKGASKAQIQQMNRAVKYAKEQSVELNIRVVK